MESSAIISSEQILASVKQELRLADTTRHDIWLMELIDNAARRLGSQETIVISNCRVKVSDNKIVLPSDAIRIIAFTGACGWFNGTFVDVPFFDRCGCSRRYPSLWSIAMQQDMVLYFINEVSDGVEFDIAYIKANRDGAGRMIIREEQEIACINYACWRFSNAYPDAYTPSQSMTWKRDWIYQSDKCRGLAARRVFENEKAQIKSRMNAILSFDTDGLMAQNLFSFYYSR